jgi:hypothetical protein
MPLFKEEELSSGEIFLKMNLIHINFDNEFNLRMYS